MKKIMLCLMGICFSVSGLKADNLDEKAAQLAKSSLIIDTHIDVPYRLAEHYEDISNATEKGDFDYPRAIEGGLNAAFMSIYLPARLDGTEEAVTLADKLIDDMEKIVQGAPDKFFIACSTEEVEASLGTSRVALPMGIENGSPIAGSFSNLQHFYKRGVRYVTLTHAKSNHISDSSYDENRRWNGLSEFGKQLIPEMNRLGMMVDVSHVSDIAFYQVMEITKVPVIASHSSARHFTPGFERNMSDEMIIKLAQKDGVIQINFGSTFLTRSAQQAWDLFDAERAKFIEENKLSETDDLTEIEAFDTRYKSQHPELWATVDDVLDHIDHVVKLTSIDNVGIGSDYDGVGDSLPAGLKDVASYPALIKGLLKRGYDETAIRKLLGGNLLRVWKQVEQYAKQQGTLKTQCNTEIQGQ